MMQLFLSIVCYFIAALFFLCQVNDLFSTKLMCHEIILWCDLFTVYITYFTVTVTVACPISFNSFTQCFIKVASSAKLVNKILLLSFAFFMRTNLFLYCVTNMHLKTKDSGPDFKKVLIENPILKLCKITVVITGLEIQAWFQHGC